MNNRKIKKGLFPYVFLLIFIIGCLILLNSFNTTINNLSYDEFKKELNDGTIKELELTPKIRTETYEVIGKLKDCRITLPCFSEAKRQNRNI